MNAYNEFRVGDRVVAHTASFGIVTGSIVKVVFGNYLHIRSEANDCVYGVHENACRPATVSSAQSSNHESGESQAFRRFLRFSAEIR